MGGAGGGGGGGGQGRGDSEREEGNDCDRILDLNSHAYSLLIQ